MLFCSSSLGVANGISLHAFSYVGNFTDALNIISVLLTQTINPSLNPSVGQKLLDQINHNIVVNEIVMQNHNILQNN